MKKNILNLSYVIPSFIYLLFYVPIWNGHHFVLNNPTSQIIFIYMSFLFILSFFGFILKIYFPNSEFISYKNTKLLLNICVILSLPVFLFVGYFFFLNLLGLPIMIGPSN